ncbi:MAG: hypothetical protein H7645_02020 [Candidatus Heimdallarchaeota archaeon]|nr:hypothetical protein [Candidatus Heimdallarchaeota archaeon]MCK4769095.1 hypothetical protein [Candidatus Heimdallarchaeota archaeon]
MNNLNKQRDIREAIIRDFLLQIRKSLPFWLKEDKKEVNEILREIEDHIWDRSYELAKGEEPTDQQIHFVISQMGPPNEITREYKHRGNPKFYITEELFPRYWKILLGTAIVVVLISLITTFVSIGAISPGKLVGNFFMILFFGLLASFTLTTAVLVVLSNQGFIPKGIEFESAYSDQTTRRRMQKRATLTSSISSPSTPAKLESEAKTAEPVDIGRHIVDRIGSYEQSKQSIYKRGDYLVPGILGVITGILLVSVPSYLYLVAETINLDLSRWTLFVGGLLIVTSVIRLIQALIGYHIRAQQILSGIHSILIMLNIPLFINLYDNTNILENTIRNAFPGLEADLMLILFSVSIFITILIVLVLNIYRIVKLALNRNKGKR